MGRRSIALAVACALMASLCRCGGSSSTTAPTHLVNGHLIGQYGAKDKYADLELTPTGGQLTLYCGWGGPLSGPVTLDTQGHFDVPGLFISNVPAQPVHYVGTVAGNTVSLSIVYPDGTNIASYTLNAGQQPPTYTGSCPG